MSSGNILINVFKTRNRKVRKALKQGRSNMQHNSVRMEWNIYSRTHTHTHTHTEPAEPWVYTVIFHRAWGPALALTGVLLERAAEAYFRFPSSHPPRSSTTAGRARQHLQRPPWASAEPCRPRAPRGGEGGGLGVGTAGSEGL